MLKIFNFYSFISFLPRPIFFFVCVKENGESFLESFWNILWGVGFFWKWNLQSKLNYLERNFYSSPQWPHLSLSLSLWKDTLVQSPHWACIIEGFFSSNRAQNQDLNGVCMSVDFTCYYGWKLWSHNFGWWPHFGDLRFEEEEDKLLLSRQMKI
jgi:hypothetical protein